ncbi:MAG: helix-turn-helix transcriptional regulator [Deltaproteobacteria bacterium]|jgi:transcriptional regulator with XRE-family HTH domain|nr:helix-turn-helix transcriptional regulator [Deltaproteobacteria bacterium]
MIPKEQKELFRKRVGKILEQRRMEKGLSRKELGSILGYKGDSAIQVVARFEAGRAGVPKSKIGQLLNVLEIKNEDFGLSGSKSLKNFIAAGSFLGTSIVPWGDTMIDFLEKTEKSFVHQTIADDDDEPSQDIDVDDYAEVLRLMRLFRAPKETRQLSLIELIDTADTLSGKDEKLFCEILALLEIDPEEACNAIENHLLERLKPS